jgi:hypothetical protein
MRNFAKPEEREDDYEKNNLVYAYSVDGAKYPRE